MNNVTTIRCAMSPTSVTGGYPDKGVGMPCRHAHRHALPTGSACEDKANGGRSIPLCGPGAGRTGIKPAAFVFLNARAFTPLQAARRRALRARLPPNQAPIVMPRRGLTIGGSATAELSHRAEHAARPCAPRIALLAGAGFSRRSKCFGGRRARSASAGGLCPRCATACLGRLARATLCKCALAKLPAHGLRPPALQCESLDLGAASPCSALAPACSGPRPGRACPAVIARGSSCGQLTTDARRWMPGCPIAFDAGGLDV